MSVPTAELTNALASTTAPNNVMTLGVSGLTGIAIQISGTFSATVVFECSTDGRTFNSLYLNPVTTATPTPATSATATGYWSGSVVANVVQCRMSAWVSGAAVITMLAAPSGNAGGGSSGGGGGDATAANQVLEIADLDKLAAQIVDADTGAGTANTALLIPGKPANGGPVAGGTTTNPWDVVTGFSIKIYDYIAYTSASTTDTYVYKTGGSGGTTQGTVVVTWTDSTKTVLSTVVKT